MKKGSLVTTSPSKLSGKQNAGAKKGASSALVSDIGIVKKSQSKRDHSQSSSQDARANDNNAQSLLLEDSFEKYYNKDLDLEEDQVPVVINELNESALNFISQEQYEKALILLQKAQTMLEQIQAEKVPCDQFTFLLTLHNMAMCYQKLGILEECSICLEACIEHMNSDYLRNYFNDPEHPSLKLKMLKYRCKTHMQICALLSQIHKHKEAVYHSNRAIKIAHYLINESKNQCEFYVEQFSRSRNDTSSIIGDRRYSLLEKTAVKLLPIMTELQKRMAIEDYRMPSEGGNYITGPVKLSKAGPGNVSPTRRGNVAPSSAGGNWMQPPATYTTTTPSVNTYNCGLSNMKNVLGYLNQSEWVYSLNIGNIMQISPLTLQDFLSQTAVSLEISREFLLEKMCFLAVSYFCMGTEYRFLHQQKEVIQEQTFERKDSEYWHGKAVEMAISFLPSESPLVSHILMSYEKHHSPSSMVIPEAESHEKYVRIVRQTAGIDSCRLQPIIRHHPDSEYRVSKIDHNYLNWHKIFKTDEYTRQQQRVTSEHKRQSSSGQAAPGPGKSKARVLGSKTQFNSNPQMRNFTTREMTQQQQLLASQKAFEDPMTGDTHMHAGDDVMNELDSPPETEDDEIQRPVTHDANGLVAMSRDAPELFYKSGGKSAENLSKDREKFRSDERSGNRLPATREGRQTHSHSMNMDSAEKEASFDNQRLNLQHRNSADSEQFNNKGNRKLRPATKEGDNKQRSKRNAILDPSILGEAGQSSQSLDDLDIQQTHKDDLDKRFSQTPGIGAPAPVNSHRRAKSSGGIGRKTSKHNKDSQIKAPLGPLQSANSSRGVMLSQLREKNSSSAMAQLQPRGSESGPKMPTTSQQHLNSQDMLEDVDQRTYLTTNQSQPLSVLTSDNQLMLQKSRTGQSQQHIMNANNTKKITNSGGGTLAPTQQRRFKNNPQILSSDMGGESSEPQFMGKRNVTGQQATAPAQGSRKKQANTINVESLPKDSTHSGHATVSGAQSHGHKLAPAGAVNSAQHAGTVRAQSHSGSTVGQAIGSGPSNNGFVANTANIDQSSKNTINVYQFGSGVNFNLKLAAGQTGEGGTNVSRKQYEQIQNALNQMNSIDGPGPKDRHSSSLEEKSFEVSLANQNQNTAALKQQITQIQANYNGQKGSTGQNFNNMVVPSASSKRSGKLGQSSGPVSNPGSSGQQRRKSSHGGKNASNSFQVGAFMNSSQTQMNPNSLQAREEIVQLIKKREKLNNSALAQIESTAGSSRKFTQAQGSSQTGQKFTQKMDATGQDGGSRSQQKQRRQLSNTDKGINWNNGQGANSAQLTGAQRKQGGLGARKTSLEQKFSTGAHGFREGTHHRGMSDISHQLGYKGIGSNLGTGDNGPSAVNLTGKLQGPPSMSEHASMPNMSSNTMNQRFMSVPQNATQSHLSSGNPDIIPSFIQRQQPGKYSSNMSSGASANQQKKAQAYLTNQQQRR